MGNESAQSTLEAPLTKPTDYRYNANSRETSILALGAGDSQSDILSACVWHDLCGDMHFQHLHHHVAVRDAGGAHLGRQSRRILGQRGIALADPVVLAILRRQPRQRACVIPTVRLSHRAARRQGNPMDGSVPLNVHDPHLRPPILAWRAINILQTHWKFGL